MCTVCSHACEEKQGRWICTNCNRPYDRDQGDTEMASQEVKPTTCRNGVANYILSETQEPGHQSPPSSLSKTADEDESLKAWYPPHGVEVSQSSRDQTRDGSVPTPSEGQAFQGSCSSAARGCFVAEDSPGQEEAGPDESHEPMHLDNNDEELNDETFRSWIDERNRQGMDERRSNVGHVLDLVESFGFNSGNPRSIVLQDELELEISDNTDME
ncbi:hypothetical protein IL306_008026 [Fusarium sp. DS 682]|nr:hypothetical protein IL306_008026 [Fusarium sp. DS 682]